MLAVQGVPREFPVALENVLRLAIEMNATGRHVWVGLPPVPRVDMACIPGRT